MLPALVPFSPHTMYQGCVTRRIRIIRRIVINAYFTVLNKSGHIIRLQNMPFCRFLPFWGLFRQFPPHQRLLSQLPMLLYNVLITHNILERKWERFGWFWGESGPFLVKNRHFRNCLKIRSYYTRIPYLTRIFPY